MLLLILHKTLFGTNNVPLLKREGNFGNRAKPANSADRYIFTCKEDYLESLFMSDDTDVLIEQIFEGDVIEPKYYVPVLPLLLVNGSEGVSVGFAQKILPRNPVDISNSIKEILDDKPISSKLLPYYNGFKGDIIEREDGGFEIRGTFKKVGKKIVIEELPIGYDLKSYKKVLNSLEEKKIISEYSDLTDTKKSNNFKFEVIYKDIDRKSDLEILEVLKLIKRVSENFTAMDEDNIIKVFQSPEEILRSFVKIRLEYYEKRKLNKIEKLEYELKILKNKLKFITDVINEKIFISNKTKEHIIKQLNDAGYYDKIEDSYDYLLRMQIYSLTNEKITELTNTYLKTKKELVELKNKNIKV